MTTREIADAEDLVLLLNSLPVPSGYGWLLRPSTTGRGWRLLTTRQLPNFPTATEAIRAFGVLNGEEMMRDGEVGPDYPANAMPLG